MAFVDYYKILGVDKNIPQKDVRAAYRKRAKQFHPDLHPNDPKAKAKFQALNEAYEVISDPDKRAKYDQYGEQWKNVGVLVDLVASAAVPVAAIRSKDSTSASLAVVAEASLVFLRISSAEVHEVAPVVLKEVSVALVALVAMLALAMVPEQDLVLVAAVAVVVRTLAKAMVR